MRESNAETDFDEPTDEQLHNSDVDAEDTPIGRTILDRPEVRDVTVHMGHQCVIVNVLFETWSIPTDFAAQYDMRLHSARLVDDRAKWKRVFGWGRTSWIEGRFVRDQRHVEYSEG